MSIQTRQSSDPSQQSILLVTGLSGAGKSTALQVLEDLGWETIDNFPVRLLKRLISNPDEQPNSHSQGPIAIGFDSRTRGFVPTKVIDLVKELTEFSQVQLTTLFVDCSSSELERRYNETRRRHPMAHGRPLQDGIRAERELLEPMRRWADIVVDTSTFATNELQQNIRELFGESTEQPMTVTVSSFGFARGMPPLADLVFDMRFLDNPHWIDGLRELTGLDQPVGEHIQKDPGFAPSIERMEALIADLLPRYQAQGKSYVHIAFGCTGGRHRSVFTAEHMGEALRERGFSPTVRHRNLGSRATDAIEQMKR